MEAKKPSEEKKPDVVKTPVVKDLYAPPLWLKIIGPVAGIITAFSRLVTRVGNEFYNKEKNKPAGKYLSELRHRIIDGLDMVHSDHDMMPGSSKSHDPMRLYLNAIANHVEDYKPVPGTVLESVAHDLEAVGNLGINNLIKDPTNTKLLSAEQMNVYKSYNHSLNTIIEQKGFHTKGLKKIFQGTFQRWGHIGREARQNILVDAIISAGVVMASLFVLNLNSRLRTELRDIHGKLGDLSSAGDVPETAPIKEATLMPVKDMPSSQVDTQDAQHDRFAAAQTAQQRA